MGLRETVRRRPRGAIGGAIVLVLLASALTFWETRAVGIAGSKKAFFSTDEGATWFTDSIEELPPFVHDGKEADRAYVYDCNGKRFVNFLERYTPEKLKYMEAVAEASRTGSPPPKPPTIVGQPINWGSEVKKPGDKTWTAGNNLAKAVQIMKVSCPDGGDPVAVAP